MSVSHQLSHQEKKMCTREDVVKGHRFPSLAFCSYESEKVRVEVRKWEGQLSLHLAKCGQNAGWKQEKDEKKLNVTEMHLTLDSPQDCPWMRESLKSDETTQVILTSLLAGNIWTISCQLTSAHQRRSWISQRRISDLRWPLAKNSPGRQTTKQGAIET